MLWRKLNLNWQYAVGEFAIVVLGVLSALWVDNWNADRKDRVLEKRYVESLISDLERDLFTFERNIGRTAEIMGHVNRVLEMLRVGEPLGTADQVIANVTNSARFTLTSQQRITYDDLQSTGNLRIIQSDRIRSEIAQYYASWNFRAQWRGTWRSYQDEMLDVLPEVIDPNIRDAVFFSDKDVPWYMDNVDLTQVDSAALVARMVEHPTFATSVHNMRRAHGLNYGFATESKEEATGLIESLREYYDSL